MRNGSRTIRKESTKEEWQSPTTATMDGLDLIIYTDGTGTLTIIYPHHVNIGQRSAEGEAILQFYSEFIAFKK